MSETNRGGDYAKKQQLEHQRQKDRAEFSPVIEQAWQLRKTLGENAIWRALDNFRINDPITRKKLHALMKRDFKIRDRSLEQARLRDEQEDQLINDITTEEQIRDVEEFSKAYDPNEECDEE